MKRIREEQEISIADIHEETMISEDVIQSFEEHGLLEHPRFNRVYLRSFVRSYAQCVGVDANTAVSELENALNGRYTNQLAVAYLGEEPEELPSARADEETPQETASPVPDAQAETPTRAASSDASESTSGAASKTTPEDTDQEDASSASGGSQRALLIGLGIVLIVLLAWMGVSLLEDSGSEAIEAEPPSQRQVESSRTDTMDTTDTTVASTDTAASQPEPPITLGDTLYFTLVADEDKIEAVRIRRDDDLRRPYWIEQGQVAVFPAQQQVTIEPIETHFRLLINGYPWPRQTQDQLTLARSDVRSFLDTVSADPVEVAPDTTLQIPGTQATN